MSNMITCKGCGEKEIANFEGAICPGCGFVVRSEDVDRTKHPKPGVWLQVCIIMLTAMMSLFVVNDLDPQEYKGHITHIWLATIMFFAFPPFYYNRHNSYVARAIGWALFAGLGALIFQIPTSA